ncbi:MAG: hypothetical protein Q7K42_00015, partial [Candidatus Diapherotrites archaeon]|nr:hypothetical protein [Candidatus Diapherotrites archaeon]
MSAQKITVKLFTNVEEAQRTLTQSQLAQFRELNDLFSIAEMDKNSIKKSSLGLPVQINNSPEFRKFQ